MAIRKTRIGNKPPPVSMPTGRFVICPVSNIPHPRTGRPVHPPLYAPITQGKSGCFFAECGECKKKIFLPDFWVWEMGWLPQDAPRIGAIYHPPASQNPIYGPPR